MESKDECMVISVEEYFILRDKAKAVVLKNKESGYIPLAVKVSPEPDKEKAHLDHCVFELYKKALKGF